MKKYIYLLCCTMAPFICSLLAGCSSSDESVKMSPAAVDSMRTSLTSLKTQNDSLRLQVAGLARDNQSANAHANDLQSQVNDLKAKLTAAPPTPTHPVISDMREAYEECLKMFRARNYEQAGTTLQSLIDGGIAIDLQDNCYYWLGECSYAMKQYAQAIEHFQKVFTFKVSEKKDDAQIMIANSYYASGDKEKAKEEYQKFLDKFPASPYAQRAKDRLAKF